MCRARSGVDPSPSALCAVVADQQSSTPGKFGYMDSTTALVSTKVCLLRAVGSGFIGLPHGLQNAVRTGARRIPILSTPLSALVLDRRVNEGTIDPADPWQVRNNGGQADELRLMRS